MLSHLAIACILSCVFCVQISVAEECTLEAISACATGFEATSKDIVPTDFDARCRIMTDVGDCLLRKIQSCPIGQNLRPQYDVLKSMVDDFCTPQSVVRKLYEKHGKCLSTLESDLKYCQENLGKVLSRPASGNAQMIARACCGQTQLVDCAVSVITKKCNAEASQSVTEAQKIATNANPQLQVCNNFKAEDERCQQYLFLPNPEISSLNSGISLMSSIALGLCSIIALALAIIF